MTTDSPDRKFGGAGLLIAALVLLAITVIARWIAQEYDGAVANILTLILGFVTWLLAIGGLIYSPWPRALWRLLALAPFLIILITLSTYKVARLDGSLVPQLVSRWQPAVELPAAKPTENRAAIPAGVMAATSHDFPQFLGPDRNAIITGGVQLAPGWSANPPQVLWKQPIGAGWSGFAVQGDVAVTMEQRDSEEWIVAYDVNSGSLFWQVALQGMHFNVMGGAGPRATPTIADDRVYSQTATGQVACLELATGQVVWQVDLLKLGDWDKTASELAIMWGRSGSPLVTEKLVILPLGAPKDTPDRSLVAFDKSDGQVVWRAGQDQISYASPTRTKLLDKEQVVIVNESSVTGHDLETGKILWTVPWDGHSDSSASVSQTITVSPTQLLLSKGYAQGAKLVEFSLNEQGEFTAKEIWQKTSVLKTKFTNAVVQGEFAYALSDGLLECVRIADGAKQWRGRGYGHGQLLLVNDLLLITSETGDLALVAADPKEFKQLARMPVLTGVTWNVPSLSGDRLLIRNADEAACLKLPVRQ